MSNRQESEREARLSEREPMGHYFSAPAYLT